MQGLIAYLVAAMIAWVPLGSQVESTQESEERYESIARDAAAVAFDEAEPTLFDGPDGRVQTALLLLSVASYESAYHKTVDEGSRRGDHGASYCLMQIRVGDGTTSEGWTGADLVENRTRCFRSALHILRGSFNVCRKLPLADRMSAYATGRCVRGSEVSRQRVQRAWEWWASHPQTS
jgi:hypothetical protein